MTSMTRKPLLDLVLEHPEFSRKARLPSLYSDFAPLKISNADGYQANVKAWLSALNSAFAQQLSGTDGALCITMNTSLVNSLTSSQWGKPLALPAIEAEAVNRHIWVPYDEFMNKTQSIYHVPSFAESLTLSNAVRWGLSKVWTPSASKSLTGRTYVVMPLLEDLAAKVQSSVRAISGDTYSDHVMTQEMLQQHMVKATSTRLDVMDMQVFLRFLERDKACVSTQEDVIKFAAKNKPDPITQVDIAVAQLKSTIHSLTIQIDDLSYKSATCTQAAKSAVSKNQKTVALSALRTQKLTDATIADRTGQLSQLEQILTKIDDTASNIGIIKAMESGSSALSKLLREVGDLDTVTDLVDTVHEQMQISDEIGQAVKIHTDEDDVEEEWLTMCREREEADLQKKQDTAQQIRDSTRQEANPQKAGVSEQQVEEQATERQENNLIPAS